MTSDNNTTIDLLDPIWERQPGEPTLWYDRFQIFLTLGPRRSLRGAYTQELRSQPLKEHNKNSVAAHAGKLVPALNGDWSTKALLWRWLERATAYDDNQRKIELEQQEQGRKQMLDRQIDQAKQLQDKIFTKLLDASFTEPKDMMALWKTALEIEQKARGVPNVLLHIMSLSNEELLQRYEQFLAGMGLYGGRDQTPGPGQADPFPTSDPDDDKPSL